MISIFIHWRNITAFHKHTNNITLVGVKAIYRFLKMNDSANARQFELYAVLSSKSMFTSNVRSHAQVFSLLIDDNFVDEYCKFIYKNNKPILILILYYSIIPIFFFSNVDFHHFRHICINFKNNSTSSIKHGNRFHMIRKFESSLQPWRQLYNCWNSYYRSQIIVCTFQESPSIL